MSATTSKAERRNFRKAVGDAATAAVEHVRQLATQVHTQQALLAREVVAQREAAAKHFGDVDVAADLMLVRLGLAEKRIGALAGRLDVIEHQDTLFRSSFRARVRFFLTGRFK